ncbi:(2Fe-2S)-binding protein [Pseudomonas koreensis]|jgi:aerobic-type carbon monoxide dehydrogenase small subunit (CoxS/CutS family)|uniref:(2Fe-2S)-binding protein n=1 Tax=Pseudomonas sp. GXM4 TaxID=2651867 RepID=UPI0008AE5760|nr:(2Fe-2S)-binding protein [Pseudomonas sp. GXM4]KAB2523181.1 (2Fe-2S)-binding protein [Pseudomonas sp. GXM4]OFJ44729.1 (2Fe-2S)-binding protein [Pseudomonas koreensis]PYB89264.1 (2Fe-2S)-binding protein [Pseudomonas koreensis]CAH0202317.1 Nicotinate dehydrogenase subunit A [Pseudomonas koreensis]
MSQITLTVNGAAQVLELEADMPLLYALRNHLNLNGAKYGCGLGQCGACTVIVDDQPVFACLTPCAGLEGKKIRTVESLGSAEKPGPLQAAFIDKQAAQCGYCIAGMLMRAQALLERDPHPDEQTIREHMAGNLCRCGTHLRIIEAIKQVAGHNGSRT